MKKRKLVFVWDNFGPIHADRCEAVSASYGKQGIVYGIELRAESNTYKWKSESRSNFNKVTLSHSTEITRIGSFFRSIRLIRELLKHLGADYFFCHYESIPIFVCAMGLRILGQRVFIMNDSKFDDYPRFLLKELVKVIFYLPYRGGIAAGTRSSDYMRFLGVSKNRIKLHYNAMSLERLARQVDFPQAPEGLGFYERHFIVITRLVEKKNLFMVLQAYAEYIKITNYPRELHIVGSGPLSDQLEKKTLELNISDKVIFHGFLQTVKVTELLGKSLCLLLLSTEEQFGNVVIEAQAMGLPCIVSTACGARDLLIRSGVNGFVIEPDNPIGTGYFMEQLSCNQKLWETMCRNVNKTSANGDVLKFAESVRALADER